VNVYRIKSNRPVFSFGDEMGDVPILGTTLSTWQEEVIANTGDHLCDIEHEEEIASDTYCAFPDHIVLSKKAWLHIRRKIISEPASSFRVALASGTFNQRYVLGSDPSSPTPTDIVYRAGETDPSLWILPQEIFQNAARLPVPLLTEPVYHIDFSPEFVSSLRNPFDLLWANTALNIARAYSVARLIPKRFRPKPGRLRTHHRTLRLINKRGKGCEIHPTAVIEGCVLGDNVSVGAHAVLRLAHIGSGTIIEDQASVTQSVIGENNFIANKNHVSYSLTYPEVFLIHGPYQFAVFGCEASVFATISCDVRIDRKNIVMPTADGLIDSGQPLLGVAYGHRCKVAAGSIIAPGRIVPNDLVIQPPDHIISRFNDPAS
jgi:hypothetical protein